MRQYTVISLFSARNIICFLVISILGLYIRSVCAQDTKKTVYTEARVFTVEEGLAQSTVYDIHQDSRGLIWVATGSGLQCFDGNEFRSFHPPQEISAGLPNKTIYEIQEDTNSGFLLSTGKYLLKFDERDGSFQVLDTPSPHDYSSDSLTELIRTNELIPWDLPGNVDDLLFISRQGKYADTIDPVIRTVLKDLTGNLWFGTDGHGLLFYSKVSLTFDVARIGFTRCITYYQGDIWAGTFKNGLWRMRTDLSVPIRVNPGQFTDDIYFFDLAADSRGRLWATTSAGVFIMDANGEVLFEEPLASSSGKFLELPDGRMYLSSYDKLYYCETGPRPGLEFIREQTYIRELRQVHGCFWVGNHFGLYRTDTAQGFLAACSFQREDRIDSSQVYSIIVGDTLIWTGTEEGIHIFSVSGERQPLAPSLKEISGETVYSLSRDEQGRTWFAGNKGIGCITADLGRVIRFSSNNNLQSAEFNFNADLRLPDGRLYLGGINGLNGLDPNDYDFKSPPPEVRLISLEVADTMFTPGLPPQGSIELKLTWQNPHISGTVFSPGYYLSGMTGYSYLLENYDQDWSMPSTNNRFTFRNLPPGVYRLWVKCIDPYQNEGKPELMLQITIPPPFWKTWWFILLMSTFLVLFTGLIIKKLQEIRFKQKMSELERQYAIEQERLRISRDMHDEIGASLTQIAILSELIKRQESREVMLPNIERISEISGEVIDGMGEIIWAMNPKNDTLPIFASYLRRHAQEYLASAGIEGKVSFPPEFPPIPMTSEQRRNIFLVVKEALHNAVKHSQAGDILLTMAYHEGMLELQIRDNGRGFEPSSCMERGNGLASMQKRVEALGGIFVLHSAPGQGTELALNVKLQVPGNNTKV